MASILPLRFIGVGHTIEYSMLLLKIYSSLAAKFYESILTFEMCEHADVRIKRHIYGLIIIKNSLSFILIPFYEQHHKLRHYVVMQKRSNMISLKNIFPCKK